MKILYLNAYLNRFDFWTGERGRQFVEALRAAGAEVQTMPEIPSRSKQATKQSSSLTAGVKRFAQTRLSERSLVILIEIYLLGRGIARTLQLAWQAWRNRHDLRPDVVLARTFEYEWAPWLVATILRRPLVLEIHSPFFVERRFRGRGDSRFLRWYEGMLWRRAARIWVHSHALKDIVADNNIAPECIRIIPFGLPTDYLNEPIPHSNGIHVQVIFAGSFYPWHGVDLIIEAFSIAHEKIGNLRLCLIGDGVTRTTNEQRVRALGIEKCVEFTGWISREKVAQYLQHSDIGVAPYRRLEPFYFEPVKVLDYMAAGLAVVGSDQGGVRELVTDGESGILVPPDDVEALAQAFIELAENAPLRQRLGVAARERVPTLLETAQSVLAAASEVMTASRHAT